MERAQTHYRRSYASRRPSYSSAYVRQAVNKEKRNWREIILTECIICAAALAGVMLISVVNTGFTNNLRNNIKYLLSNNMSADNIIETYNKTLNSISTVKETYDKIFSPSGENELPAALQSPAPAVIPSPVPTQAASVAPDFRIDEDLLNDINSRIDYYTDSQLKKQPAPEEALELMPEPAQ